MRWDSDTQRWMDDGQPLTDQPTTLAYQDDATLTDDAPVNDTSRIDKGHVKDGASGAAHQNAEAERDTAGGIKADGLGQTNVAHRRLSSSALDPELLAKANPDRFDGAGNLAVRRSRVMELTFLGLSISEIAEDMAITQGMVKSDLEYLHYAAAYRLDIEALRMVTWQEYMTNIRQMTELMEDALAQAGSAKPGTSSHRAWLGVARGWQSERSSLMRDASKLYGLPTTTIQHRAGGRFVGLLDRMASGAASPFRDDEDE